MDYGQIAFDAYCESVNFVTYDNKPIPKWDSLSAQVKQAWEDAARAVEIEVLLWNGQG